MALPFPIEIKYIATLIFIQQIGKGAFGCVKTAIRLKDQKIIVTKFIKKNKIRSCRNDKNSLLSGKSDNAKNIINGKTELIKGPISTQFVLKTEDFRNLPEEIEILLSLNHPNIIKVLDVHENSHYFQMVMEHHGEMDLFEFVDLRHRFVTENLKKI